MNVAAQPNVLVISNRFDFSTDYVCAQLKLKSVRYLRLNTDQFTELAISYDPNRGVLSVRKDAFQFYLNPNDIDAVFFRAATYLRGDKGLDPHNALSKQHWQSFVIGLMSFGRRWINHPTNVYMAENKMNQLRHAAQSGFKLPETFVGNDPRVLGDLTSATSGRVATKGLDTLFYRTKEEIGFGYTEVQDASEVASSSWAELPFIVQEALEDKIDIRATIVGDQIFAVKIVDKATGTGIDGDWRREKERVSYQPTQLPANVKTHCLALMKSLGLFYGAIDLASIGEDYYFLEINPTGEWGWLMNCTEFPISETIANWLKGDKD